MTNAILRIVNYKLRSFNQYLWKANREKKMKLKRVTPGAEWGTWRRSKSLILTEKKFINLHFIILWQFLHLKYTNEEERNQTKATHSKNNQEMYLRHVIDHIRFIQRGRIARLDATSTFCHLSVFTIYVSWRKRMLRRGRRGKFVTSLRS